MIAQFRREQSSHYSLITLISYRSMFSLNYYTVCNNVILNYQLLNLKMCNMFDFYIFLSFTLLALGSEERSQMDRFFLLVVYMSGGTRRKCPVK